MKHPTLKIDVKEMGDPTTSLLLAEFVRGTDEIDPTDNFQLEEVKKDGLGALVLLDERFEAEAVCKPQTDFEHHALAYVDGGKLRLVPLAYSFAIGKRVKTETQKVVRRGSMNYQEKKELVVQEIGTTKSKKILKNYKTKTIDQNKIASMDEIQELMDQRASGLRAETQTQRKAETDQKAAILRELLPPFNVQAGSPQEIYDLEMLMGKKVVAKIDSAIFENKVATGRLSKLGSQVWEKVHPSLDKLSVDQKKGWAFLDALLSIFPLRKIVKAPADLAKEKGQHQQVVQEIVDRFYQSGAAEDGQSQWVKTHKTNLRFAAHITVLFLLLNNLKFELAALFPVLGVPESELTNQLHHPLPTARLRRVDQRRPQGGQAQGINDRLKLRNRNGEQTGQGQREVQVRSPGPISSSTPPPPTTD
jgi:hypothetical protein